MLEYLIQRIAISTVTLAMISIIVFTGVYRVTTMAPAAGLPVASTTVSFRSRGAPSLPSVMSLRTLLRSR